MERDEGGRRTIFDHHVDAAETRTVRESAERAAAAVQRPTSASATDCALTGNGNTSGPSMSRPEGHRVSAAGRCTESNKVQRPPEVVETKPEPEVEKRRYGSAGDAVCGVAAACSSFQPRPEMTSSSSLPEIVTRLNRKPSYREPTRERFDRVVQYYDSRQRISGNFQCSLP